MLIFKQLLLDCGITQDDFALMAGWSKPYISAAINGKSPTNTGKFKTDMEAAVSKSEILAAWLRQHNYEISDIWSESKNLAFSLIIPRGIGEKISNGMKKHYKHPALCHGDPLTVQQPHKEAQMLTQQAMKQFKIFRSPFINDIADTGDIFLSEDHIFLKEMMLDTAKHAGFTAVFGEVGSGKSVMRKAVVQELINENIKIIYPVIIDKTRITPGSLVDAIIMDISEETPKRSLEAKTRQAIRLLKNRAMSGMKQTLIVEEAHLLKITAIKALKQIYELEQGFSRLIGIILIGQIELKLLLDESNHPEIREVTRRITCAEIAGLDEPAQYINHKFQRIKKNPSDIFSPEAYEAIRRRLQKKDGRRTVSIAHPLTINNFVSRAINMAVQMGEERVTDEIIMNL